MPFIEHTALLHTSAERFSCVFIEFRTLPFPLSLSLSSVYECLLSPKYSGGVCMKTRNQMLMTFRNFLSSRQHMHQVIIALVGGTRSALLFRCCFLALSLSFSSGAGPLKPGIKFDTLLAVEIASVLLLLACRLLFVLPSLLPSRKIFLSVFESLEQVAVCLQV